MRLVDVEPYLDTDGVMKYIGVWREAGGAQNIENTDWSTFVSKFNTYTTRLSVYKTYTDANGSRKFLGVWREGNTASYLWSGVDRENFMAQHVAIASANARLVGTVSFPGACISTCTNLVVSPSAYNYMITGTSNYYRDPTNVVNGVRYARLSALSGTSQIFKLPFTDPAVQRWNGWLYGTNSWHWAVDYSIDLTTSFQVKAAAAGVVQFIGWDNWSGNTIIVRHNSAEGTDTYRTIYMHVRNGANNDCSQAWTKTIPTLSGSDLTNYRNILIGTGCTQDPTQRNLNSNHWGTNAQTIPVTVGQTVTQGQFIAHSGETGPGGALGGGGNPNNHLHIFHTRKDTNNEFYFIDPYGIYGVPNCYPTSTTGPYSGTASACARYPILFQNGYPQYP
jgi:murein DD-endopeptidase MepM/ murein hydrolase activator NlpD